MPDQDGPMAAIDRFCAEAIGGQADLAADPKAGFQFCAALGYLARRTLEDRFGLDGDGLNDVAYVTDAYQVLFEKALGLAGTPDEDLEGLEDAGREQAHTFLNENN